jgi:hypothetical protein
VLCDALLGSILSAVLFLALRDTKEMNGWTKTVMSMGADRDCRGRDSRGMLARSKRELSTVAPALESQLTRQFRDVGTRTHLPVLGRKGAGQKGWGMLSEAMNFTKIVFDTLRDCA